MPKKPHMGLTSWEQYPNGKIQKYDVSIAKNYLSKEELQALERIVTMYLDYAEYQASRHIPHDHAGLVAKTESLSGIQ